MQIERSYQPTTITAPKVAALHGEFGGERVKTKFSTRKPWLKLAYNNNAA
jgi:hypothetical protein